jgi:hypothetical protein
VKRRGRPADAAQVDAFPATARKPKRVRKRNRKVQGPLQHVHVVSLSGGRDSAAMGIWAAREYEAGRIAFLRYVYVHVGSRMEPETLEWLARYEDRVLRPRGLFLDVVQGDVDAWSRQFERP